MLNKALFYLIPRFKAYFRLSNAGIINFMTNDRRKTGEFSFKIPYLLYIVNPSLFHYIPLSLAREALFVYAFLQLLKFYRRARKKVIKPTIFRNNLYLTPFSHLKSIFPFQIHK